MNDHDTTSTFQAAGIDAELARSLHGAGIHDPDEVRGLGATQVWDRLHAAGQVSDVDSLYRLQGLANQIDYQNLDPSLRRSLGEHVRGAHHR